MSTAIVGKCKVCGGDVVEITTQVFNSESGSPIIGPASKNQYKDVIERHCSACGILYKFPPPVSNPCCEDGGMSLDADSDDLTD